MSLSDSHRDGSPACQSPKVTMLLTLCLLFAASHRAERETDGDGLRREQHPEQQDPRLRADLEGVLYPLPGTPFPTGGRRPPDGRPEPGEPGAVRLGPELIISGNRLFAVNSGSDTIAVFNIRTTATWCPSTVLLPLGWGQPREPGPLGRHPGGGQQGLRPRRGRGSIPPSAGPTTRHSTSTRTATGPDPQLDDRRRRQRGGRARALRSRPRCWSPRRGKVVFDATFLGFTIDSFLLGPTAGARGPTPRACPGARAPTADNPLRLPRPARAPGPPQ